MEALKRPHCCINDAVSNEKRKKIVVTEEIILKVAQEDQSIRLTSKRVDDLSEVTVLLKDIWSHSQVKPGQLIAVLDVSNPFSDVIEVGMEEGMITVEPLFLISPTVLTSAMFCERKAMLNERFRNAVSNRHMLLGSVVHEVFQAALAKGLSRPSKEDLQELAKEILLIKFSIDLVVLDEKIEDFMSALVPYLENCSSWLKMYAPKPIGFSKPLDKGSHRMSKVSGIEDYISDKGLGLKGKIDVSFEVFNETATFLLELKTGKSAKSLEHQTQVFLYSLMLKYSVNHMDVVPGWILYLKDLQLYKVESRRQDLTGVLHMRNCLASRLNDLTFESFSPISKDVKFCENCEQRVNCSLINSFGEQSTCKTKDSTLFMASLIDHLDEKSLDYCKRWILMNFMELSEQKTRNEENFLKKTTSNLDGYTTFSLTMQNTSLLMENTCEMAKLRDIIIGMRKPFFKHLTRVPLAKIDPFLEGLDDSQRDAVIKCLRAEDFSIIQGFPGAGKTTTMCAFIRSLICIGRTAVVTAHTNSAVDNILLKVSGEVSPYSVLRIGNQNSVHPDCYKFTLEYRLDKILKNEDNGDPQKKMVLITKLLTETPMIFTTCLMASSHALFSIRRFDYCIVDEASQVIENVVLKPLACSNVFVMVGDIKQLNPLVVSKAAANEGMAISLMERLLNHHGDEGEHTVILFQQYRMNQAICSLSSKMFYNEKLVCANKLVAEKALIVCPININENINPVIINKVISAKLEDSVLFIDTYSRKFGSEFSANAAVGSKSRYNPGEAAYVIRLCEFLIESGLPSAEIGIASPYKGQVEFLVKKLEEKFSGNAPECSTIDRYQGRDKSIMILSLVDGGPEGKNQLPDLLSDPRRLNVALTRAKKKLILVGCKETLTRSSLIEQLLKKIKVTLRL